MKQDDFYENTDNELTEDDIAAYYRNTEDSEDEFDIEPDVNTEATIKLPVIESVPEKNESRQENETYTAPAADENEESAEEYEEEHKAENKKTFYLITVIAAVIVAAAAFFAGTGTYWSNEEISAAAERMRKTNSEYVKLGEKIQDADKEAETLKKETDEVQEELNTLTDYESNTGEIKSELNAAKGELDDLKSELNSYEKKSSQLANEISGKLSETVTLTPGTYTAGQNINPGQYKIEGDGVLVISSKSGSVKINTELKGEGLDCRIDDGDIVRLEMKAKLVPSGEGVQ